MHVVSVLWGVLFCALCFLTEFIMFMFCKQRKGKSNKVCKKLCGNAFECEYHYFNKNKRD